MLGLKRNNITDKNLIKTLRVIQSLDEDANPFKNDIYLSKQNRDDISYELIEDTNIIALHVDILKELVAETVGKTFISEEKAIKYYKKVVSDIIAKSHLISDNTEPIFKNFVGSVYKNSSENTSVGNLTIINAGDSNIRAITLSGIGASNFSVNNNGNVKVGVVTKIRTHFF